MDKKRWYRNFILNLWASQPSWHFVSIIVICILVVVLISSFAYYLAGPISNFSLKNLPFISDKLWLPCLERSFLEIVTLSTDSSRCRIPIAWLDKVLSVINVFFGFFFFASIVALFTAIVLRPKKVFELKESLNIVKREGVNKIAFSVVNFSPVNISNLRACIIARVRVDEETIRNIELRSESLPFPLAEPYIPLRVYAPLSDKAIAVSEVDEDGYVSKLSHQRATDIFSLEVFEIYVNISGFLEALDQQVYTSKRYSIKSKMIFSGHFKQIRPDYDYARSSGLFSRITPPKGFIENFDSNDSKFQLSKKKIFVFGYGSLVSPKSFSQTIGRDDWTVDQFPLAILKGYRREWNVAMDNSQIIDGYKRYADSDNKNLFPKCFICFLNIEPSDSNEVIGVLAEVNKFELDELTARERNYDKVDITTSLVHPPTGGTVYTFIGSKGGKSRFKEGLEKGELVIPSSYYSQLDNAFRSRGEKILENYKQTLKPDKCEIRDLQLIKL